MPPPSSGTPGSVVLDEYARAQPHTNLDSLRIKDVQQFMKSLRGNISKRRGSARVKFYAVGEYGERTHRPHYHIALFGEDFSDDRRKWRTAGSYTAWRSSRLEALWPHGNAEIGELTIDSAAYIARYVLKKVNGKMKDEHYRRDLPDGQVIWITPEFALMSRRPGIGSQWIWRNASEVYPADYVVINGQKSKPPRYYDKLLAIMNPQMMDILKIQREQRALELAADNTAARLEAKETVLTAKLNTKRRELE